MLSPMRDAAPSMVPATASEDRAHLRASSSLTTSASTDDTVPAEHTQQTTFSTYAGSNNITPSPPPPSTSPSAAPIGLARAATASRWLKQQQQQQSQWSQQSQQSQQLLQLLANDQPGQHQLAAAELRFTSSAVAVAADLMVAYALDPAQDKTPSTSPWKQLLAQV
jgi:hypothetical protein